jgi:prenyltransferase beta subunit
MSSSAAGSSASSGSATSTDIKAPLWDHVHITERAKVGSSTKWKCKCCNYNGFSSYTRVEAHLIQIKKKGITSCAKATHEILTQMRKEVEKCKDMVERSRVKGVC